MKNRIIAALVATAALIAVSGSASAAPYNLYAWYQRSSSGTLSSLLFKAGPAQGCPNFGALYIQPCYNPTIPNTSGQNQWQIDNGIIAHIIAAGQPTWDWNGTTLTVNGMFWATSHVGSNPGGTQVLSDRINFNAGSYGGTMTITPGTSTTAGMTSYECIEGVFLKSVGADGCLNVNTAGSNIAAVSTALYNQNGGDPNCVIRTVTAPDTDTGPPRALFNRAAASPCDAVEGGFIQYTVIHDAGGLLILANSGTAGVLSSIGTCLYWGTQSTGAPAGSPAQPFGAPCPPSSGPVSISYLVLLTPAAAAADSDGDTMPNVIDNCTTLANGDQFDGDGDGYGNRCDGDFGNPAPGNGATNAQDYAIFRTRLGSSPGDVAADLNHNGTVNTQDYAIFRTLLGAAPGPSALH